VVLLRLNRTTTGLTNILTVRVSMKIIQLVVIVEQRPIKQCMKEKYPCLNHPTSYWILPEELTIKKNFSRALHY
jgi:hypothetical protein